jgi:acyl carrier protein
MSISSRTPEGSPCECPICGAIENLEPSDPGGDAICPACGQLLWWFRQRTQPAAQLEHGFRVDLGVDSLDDVELVMEMEDEYDISIADDEAERVVTVRDVIRLIRKKQRERN